MGIKTSSLGFFVLNEVSNSAKFLLKYWIYLMNGTPVLLLWTWFRSTRYLPASGSSNIKTKTKTPIYPSTGVLVLQQRPGINFYHIVPKIIRARKVSVSRSLLKVKSHPIPAYFIIFHRFIKSEEEHISFDLRSKKLLVFLCVQIRKRLIPKGTKLIVSEIVFYLRRASTVKSLFLSPQ